MKSGKDEDIIFFNVPIIKIMGMCCQCIEVCIS